MAPTKLILDVDTGTDDAIAIMCAALHPDLELVGCTTVGGNNSVQNVTENTLRVLQHIGRSDIPVYMGLERPIARQELPLPREVVSPGSHYELMPLPESTTQPAKTDAVRFLIDTYSNSEEPPILVCCAPLSNVATALSLYPELAKKVPHLVMMGGGHAVVNVTPSAEFNIWADAEAAALVLSAGFEKITMVTLDATQHAQMGREDIATLRASGKPAADAAGTFIEKRIDGYRYNQAGGRRVKAPVHDAVCVASLIESELLKSTDYYVTIETKGEHTLGRTVIDTNGRLEKAANVSVALYADGPIFSKFVIDTLTR